MSRIRPIAICLCSYHNQILVIDGYDSVKHEAFYRPPGGGIEFGEYAVEAVQREFQEEFGLKLTHITQLAVLQNIFTCDGIPGHEIVYVFDAQLADPSRYGTILDGKEDDGSPFRAWWRSLDQIQQEQRPLYPDRIHDIVKTDIFPLSKSNRL